MKGEVEDEEIGSILDFTNRKHENLALLQTLKENGITPIAINISLERKQSSCVVREDGEVRVYIAQKSFDLDNIVPKPFFSTKYKEAEGGDLGSRKESDSDQYLSDFGHSSMDGLPKYIGGVPLDKVESDELLEELTRRFGSDFTKATSSFLTQVSKEPGKDVPGEYVLEDGDFALEIEEKAQLVKVLGDVTKKDNRNKVQVLEFAAQINKLLESFQIKLDTDKIPEKELNPQTSENSKT
jgi:hypothetical protein